MTYIRKQFGGAAVATTLSSGISDVATTIPIVASGGWPGAGDPFVVTIDRDTATEEKVLVTRSGLTLTATTRGYDGTSAVAHSSGATIEHTLDAATVDQANRYVNLQGTKGDLVVHNGTNPVALEAPAFTGGNEFNGRSIFINEANAGGWEIRDPSDVLAQASAPNVATTVYNLWYDTTLDTLRVSDGASWLFSVQAFVFANTAARDAALPTPVAGMVCIVGTGGSLLLYVFDGTSWMPQAPRTEGIPKFADNAARDAFFVSPANGDHCYVTGTSQFQEYRGTEWIVLNQKVTVADTQPSSPATGDLWFQPVA
jgi:hypothetical protein